MWRVFLDDKAFVISKLQDESVLCVDESLEQVLGDHIHGEKAWHL